MKSLIIIFQRKKEIFEDKTGVICTVAYSFLRFEENEIKNPEELSQKEQRRQCYFRL